MKVEQVKTIVNNMYNQITGQTSILSEDLNNLADVGKTMLDATSIENFTKKMADQIAKIWFTDREYKGSSPSIYKDSFTYGSIVEKVTVETPEVEENPSWNLQDGQTYSQDKFYQPKINVTFFNHKTTYQIPMSFTEEQVKSAFLSKDELNKFFDAIYLAVDRKLTANNDNLIMSTIDKMIYDTVLDALCHASAITKASTLTTASTTVAEGTAVSSLALTSLSTCPKVVKLLSEYNTNNGTTLTATKALNDTNFLAYSAYRILVTADRMKSLSTVFNISGRDCHTPIDAMHLVLLSDFGRSADVFLQSQTFHNELTKLPNYETVPYWQGSGLNYEFDAISSIKLAGEGKSTYYTYQAPATDGSLQSVKVKDSITTGSLSGILGVLFDDYAVGVTNENRRIKTHLNEEHEFFTNFYKVDASYFIAHDENFVVFMLA